MRAIILSAALIAAALLLFAVRRSPPPPEQTIISGAGGDFDDSQQLQQLETPQSDGRMSSSRRSPEKTTDVSADLKAATSDTVSRETLTAAADACPSCGALAEEIAQLKEKLARAEARANEFSFSALRTAHPEGTPIGDAIRQPEFVTLVEADQRLFVELMARHFPIHLSPAEVAWIIDGVKGTGDPRFASNIVDASIQFIGARRILDEVSRSADSGQTKEFDKEYVEWMASQK